MDSIAIDWFGFFRLGGVIAYENRIRLIRFLSRLENQPFRSLYFIVNNIEVAAWARVIECNLVKAFGIWTSTLVTKVINGKLALSPIN